MHYRSTQEIRARRAEAFERVGKIWAGCGIIWFIFAMFVQDVPVVGTVAYWGIYVGAVVATALLILAMVRISRSADEQIKALKQEGKF